MSKEYLEALEIECGELVEMDLLFLDRNGENQEKWHNSEAFKKAVEFEKKYGKSHTYILKQALERLESIDNSEPSEALGRLVVLASELGTSKDMKFAETRFPKMIITIQQALQKAQEQEKVLEIIKKKDVDIQRLVKCINVVAHNNGLPKNRQLTKEEFELVKRWVE